MLSFLSLKAVRSPRSHFPFGVDGQRGMHFEHVTQTFLPANQAFQKRAQSLHPLGSQLTFVVSGVLPQPLKKEDKTNGNDWLLSLMADVEASKWVF